MELGPEVDGKIPIPNSSCGLYSLGKGTSQEMKEDECRLSEPNVSPPTARPKELTTEVQVSRDPCPSSSFDTCLLPRTDLPFLQDNHIYATVNKPAKRQPLSEITTNDLDPNSMKSQ